MNYDVEAYKKAIKRFETFNTEDIDDSEFVNFLHYNRLYMFFLKNKDCPQTRLRLVGYSKNGKTERCAVGLLLEPNPKIVPKIEMGMLETVGENTVGFALSHELRSLIYALNDTYRLSFEEIGYFFRWRAAKLVNQ